MLHAYSCSVVVLVVCIVVVVVAFVVVFVFWVWIWQHASMKWNLYCSMLYVLCKLLKFVSLSAILITPSTNYHYQSINLSTTITKVYQSINLSTTITKAGVHFEHLCFLQFFQHHHPGWDCDYNAVMDESSRKTYNFNSAMSYEWVKSSLCSRRWKISWISCKLKAKS